jgi:small subunit ribosomal protein S15
MSDKPSSKKSYTATFAEKKLAEKNKIADTDDSVVGAAILALSPTELIKRFQKNEGDVGSSAVQVALLTQRIAQLNRHFASHPSDRHSKRGMMGMISARKSHLGYLKNTDIASYRSLIAELGLRK